MNKFDICFPCDCFLINFISFTLSILPESFRWLVSNNKILEAENVIKHIAKINGRPVPKVCIEKLNSLTKSKEQTVGKTHTLLDILRNRSLLKKSFLIWSSW